MGGGVPGMLVISALPSLKLKSFHHVTLLLTTQVIMLCNFWSGTVLAFQESLSSTTHKILSARYYPSVEVSHNSYFVASQYRPFLNLLQ